MDDYPGRSLHEAHHRVKNILAIVRSLSRRTLETATSLDDYAAHFDGRLSALARVDGMIARRADGGVDVEELVREEFLQQAADDEGRIGVAGPHVLLHGKTAEALGLAIHELAVNAVKFGALSMPRGRVRVDWATDAGVFALHWLEEGVPLVATNPLRAGFGRQLIEEGLPYQIGATTQFSLQPGGLRCSIQIPDVEAQQ